MSTSRQVNRSDSRSERQHERRRGWRRGTTVGVSAAAVAAVVAAAGLGLLSPSISRSATLHAGSSAAPAVGAAAETALAARFTVTERGVRFSFRVPASWERFSTVGTGGGPISFNRSIAGPQGAEAIIYWTSYPDGDYADPCARLLRPRPGRSAAALASAVSRAPGTRLLSGPSNVTLGGRPATRLALTVHRKDIGCHPGFFYGWREVFGGALWGFTSWNDTIRVWIVEVGGVRLFIAGLTRPHTGPALKLEVRRIVESIRFRGESTR